MCVEEVVIEAVLGLIHFRKIAGFVGRKKFLLNHKFPRASTKDNLTTELSLSLLQLPLHLLFYF